MKKRRIVLIIFIVFIGLVIAGFITGLLSKPSFKNMSSSWGTVSEETTEIKSSITIENNNPFKIILPRVKVDYTLKMNDIEMAHGKIEDIELQKGDATIEVTSYLDNSKIAEWWISHIRNNETTIVKIDPYVVIDAEFTEPRIGAYSKTIQIDTNLLEAVDMIDEKIIALGPINITIQSVSAKWGNVTNETTQLIFNVSIFNPIALTIQMPQIMFNIKMNNITLGAGHLNNTFFLKGNEYSNVEIITTIDNSMLDDWFVSHIKNNESSFLKITISSVIKYEEVSFVIDDFLIYTHQFKTDILGSEI